MIAPFRVLLVTCFVALCSSFSLTPKNDKLKPTISPPIKRVAVIGSGIAGLALAHALENSRESAVTAENIEVHVFDSRPSLNFEAGAGIQLSGGMSVLHKINPQLQFAVAKASLPMTRIRSRTKPWTGSTDTNPFTTLLEMDLEKAVREGGEDASESLIVDGNLMWYTVMRGALQEVLLNELPLECSQRVQFGMTLSGVEAQTNEGILCNFENGSVEGPFDLVVGCDGIKSAVKEYVETGAISAGSVGSEGRSAIYSGIRIQYAVADGDPKDKEQPETAELRQYFGDGAYALTGTYGVGKGRPPCRGAFLIFRDEEYIGPFKKSKSQGYPVAENVDWSQDNRSKGDARVECLRRIRAANIPTQEVAPIVEDSDRFFELGVYFHNPFSVRGWRREVKDSGGRYCILAGDAAHAMPPFLGQGANQAIQDAYSLATKIFAHNANIKNGSDMKIGYPLLSTLLNDYQHTRWRTTTNISFKAALLGYLETGGEGFLSMFRDVFFFTMGRVGVAKMVLLDGAIPRV